MKKSTIFIVLLLCIVAAELVMVFKTGAVVKNDEYVLDTKVYDMPVREPENKTVKPFSYELHTADEVDAILDEFAADVTKSMAVQQLEIKEAPVAAPVEEKTIEVPEEPEEQLLVIQDEELVEPVEAKSEEKIIAEDVADEEKEVEKAVEPEEKMPENLLPAEEKTEETVAEPEDGIPESLIPIEQKTAETEEVEKEAEIEAVNEEEQTPEIKVEPEAEPEPVAEPVIQEQKQEEQKQESEPASEPEPEPVVTENNEAKVEVQEEPVASENTQSEKKTKIAIVIDDLGLNVPFTKQISQVKAPLTVSFLPYGASNKEQVTTLKNAGFEVMVHIPMMPHIPAALAPITLSPEMDKDETQTELNKMIDRFEGTGISGVNNHMGSLLTERVKNMEYVMEVLKKRGMYFLDSKTTGKSMARKAADEYGVTYISRDVFLDNKKDYDYIMGQFHQTEKVAQKNGYAVAIGHPYSQTLKALQDWLKGADSRGFEVVHLSELVSK